MSSACSSHLSHLSLLLLLLLLLLLFLLLLILLFIFSLPLLLLLAPWLAPLLAESADDSSCFFFLPQKNPSKGRFRTIDRARRLPSAKSPSAEVLCPHTSIPSSLNSPAKEQSRFIEAAVRGEHVCKRWSGIACILLFDKGESRDLAQWETLSLPRYIVGSSAEQANKQCKQACLEIPANARADGSVCEKRAKYDGGLGDWLAHQGSSPVFFPSTPVRERCLLTPFLSSLFCASAPFAMGAISSCLMK